MSKWSQTIPRLESVRQDKTVGKLNDSLYLGLLLFSAAHKLHHLLHHEPSEETALDIPELIVMFATGFVSQFVLELHILFFSCNVATPTCCFAWACKLRPSSFDFLLQDCSKFTQPMIEQGMYFEFQTC